MIKFIKIKGAACHNLKHVDLSIPTNKLSVFTGVSGSGKSSLAFDTIYEEGRRRYIESMSSYARQFLGSTSKPEVDFIEGLSPTISIDQKTVSHNPRSTVGTVTEINDYLRLLFSKCSTYYCPNCKKAATNTTCDDIANTLLQNHNNAKMHLTSPITLTSKDDVNSFIMQGYTRVYDSNKNEVLELEDIKLKARSKTLIYLLVDRIVLNDDNRSRLIASIEACASLSNNLISCFIDGNLHKFILGHGCNDCQKSFVQKQDLDPASFSFNHASAMCHTCNGLGFHKEAAKNLIIPDDNLSIAKNGIRATSWNYTSSATTATIMDALAKEYNFSIHAPIKNLSAEAINILLYGTEKPLVIKYKQGSRTIKYEGIIPNLNRRHNETSSNWIRADIENYMEETPCSSCHGTRLNDDALAYKFCGKNIAEICAMPIDETLKFLEEAEKLIDGNTKIIAKPILKEIVSRLNFLCDVGLTYLSLSRTSSTLSGGESQRIRLASQIGSGLCSVTYVLDEPSIGLHQRDNSRLIAKIRQLVKLGNTVIVVEHDEETMLEADFLVDVGIGAGVHGGNIVFSGAPKDIFACKESITGQYLSGTKAITIPKKRRVLQNLSTITESIKKFSKKKENDGKVHASNSSIIEKDVPKLTILGASKNNLVNVDVSIPLGCFVVFSGVSGSGKSSLMNDIIYKHLAHKLNRAKVTAGGTFSSFSGENYLDKVIKIDQSPIGRTPRSNPATYTKVFDDIRELFSCTPLARARGYKSGRFSFNVDGGRCEKCQGDGSICVQMHFMSDVYVTCEECKGTRYNKETLQIKYKDKSIYDVLEMTVEEALNFFSDIPKISKKLETLMKVGLGYIKLGQSSTTLSGGEAQRVKLASELSKTSTGKTLYLLDEPTTGLHTYDVHVLIDVLQALVDQKNSVFTIEHNLDFIKCADYIIDLGPEGGNGGGKIIDSGTPEEIIKRAKITGSFTGQYLASKLG